VKNIHSGMNEGGRVLTATFGVYLFVRYVYRRYCLSNVLEPSNRIFPEIQHLFLSAALWPFLHVTHVWGEIKNDGFIIFFLSRVTFSSNLPIL